MSGSWRLNLAADRGHGTFLTRFDVPLMVSFFLPPSAEARHTPFNVAVVGVGPPLCFGDDFPRPVLDSLARKEFFLHKTDSLYSHLCILQGDSKISGDLEHY